MGVEIAKAAQALGAHVHLVLGPSSITIGLDGIHVQNVTSAQEMLDACVQNFQDSDISILSAAVADYTPAFKAGGKLKKSKDSMNIKLTKTKDILHTLGHSKKENQVVVGFALETENEEHYALGKLDKKKADLIVLNSLRNEGAGFGHDTNQVSIFSKKGKIVESELMSKAEIAQLIWDTIIKSYV